MLLLKAACSGLIFENIFVLSSVRIILSRTLDMDESSAMGLKLSGRLGFFPGLGTAIIVAFFQEVGK